MPEATPHDVRRPSTDPAHAYDHDPDEFIRLKLWEEAEDEEAYYHALVAAGYVHPAYPIPDPPSGASSRNPTPERQYPIK